MQPGGSRWLKGPAVTNCSSTPHLTDRPWPRSSDVGLSHIAFHVESMVRLHVCKLLGSAAGRRIQTVESGEQRASPDLVRGLTGLRLGSLQLPEDAPK